MVVPHGGAGVLRLWCQVVKDLPMVRGRLGALLLIAQSSAHSAASSLGVGIQSGKRGQSVLSNNEQLTMAEKRCSRKRGRRSQHSCFRKLVAAAREDDSVLSRAAPSAVRRRRNMNCYFHISTVFRMRRETLRFFLQLGQPPDLGGISERFLWITDLSL
jgi:hypothetical protein